MATYGSIQNTVPVQTFSPFEQKLDDLVAEINKLEEDKVSLWDTFNIILFGGTMAGQFLVWKWNQNPSGGYGFKTGNAFMTCSIILCGSLYVKQKFFTRVGLYKFPMAKLWPILVTRILLGASDVIQMIGLLYTTPTVASALWFSKILMVALALWAYKGFIPHRLLGSILGGVFLGVSLFIVYQQKYVSPGGGSDDGDAIIGMILLLVSGLIGGIAIVKTNHVLSDHSFDDISKYDRYFWMFLFQIPVYAVSIASNLLLGKSIAFTDFIPFYGYDYKAFLLILFLVVQYFTGTVVQGIGAQVYVVTAYSGNFATMILASALNGFIGFDWMAFLMSAILFVNAISYKLASQLEELEHMKEIYLERFTKLVYMQKKCPVGLARRARSDADFTKILAEAVDHHVDNKRGGS